MELIEQDFENEVRKFQLLKIMELNNRIREGETINSINDINELYDKNKNPNMYNNYFQIKDKIKKKKDLGIRGIRMQTIKLDEINKNIINNNKEIIGKEDNELSEKTNSNNNNNNKRQALKDLKYISYLDLNLGKQPKKEKKKKINHLTNEKKSEIELSYFHSISQVGLNKMVQIK
jgi:hypothetical protein